MKKGKILIKIFAVTGTVFVFLPVFFSLLTSIISTIRDKVPRFDFLMPMELFTLIIVGGTFITYVAYKQKKGFKSTLANLIFVVISLVLSQSIAAVSGLAADRTGKPAYVWIVIIALIVLYWACSVGLLISGIVLTKEILINKTQ
ncbi:MAG: hypothetical protein ACK40Q_03235 [Pseudothermotoga sp.]